MQDPEGPGASGALYCKEGNNLYTARLLGRQRHCALNVAYAGHSEGARKVVSMLRGLL